MCRRTIFSDWKMKQGQRPMSTTLSTTSTTRAILSCNNSDVGTANFRGVWLRARRRAFRSAWPSATKPAQDGRAFILNRSISAEGFPRLFFGLFNGGAGDCTFPPASALRSLTRFGSPLGCLWGLVPIPLFSLRSGCFPALSLGLRK